MCVSFIAGNFFEVSIFHSLYQLKHTISSNQLKHTISSNKLRHTISSNQLKHTISLNQPAKTHKSTQINPMPMSWEIPQQYSPNGMQLMAYLGALIKVKHWKTTLCP